MKKVWLGLSLSLSLSTIAVGSVLITASCSGKDTDTSSSPSITIDGNSTISGYELTASSNINVFACVVSNYDDYDNNDFNWELISSEPYTYFNLQSNGDTATLNWNNQISVGNYSLTIRCELDKINLTTSKQVNVNIATIADPTIFGDNEINIYQGITNTDLTWYNSDVAVTWLPSSSPSNPSFMHINEYGQLSVSDTNAIDVSPSGNFYNFEIQATSKVNPQKKSTKIISVILHRLSAPTSACIFGYDDLYAAKNVASTAKEEGIYSYKITAPEYHNNNILWYLCRNDNTNIFWDSLNGWSDANKTGYTLLTPSIDVQNKELHINWDNTIQKQDILFTIKISPIDIGNTLYTKDVTIHGMDQFKEVDNVDIDCPGHIGDFTVPITEGVSGSLQYTADVTYTSLFIHWKDCINQNCFWTLEGTNIPNWLSVEKSSGLLSWTDDVFQCENNQTPYDVQLKATSRQDPSKSYTKNLTLKISSGDKASMLDKIINNVLKYYDKILMLINILNNLSGPISTPISNAISSTGSMVASIVSLSAKISEAKNNFGSLSNSFVGTIIEDAQELKDKCESNLATLTSMMILAIDNSRYTQGYEQLTPVERYTDDKERASLTFALANTSFNIGKILPPSLGLPFFQSAVVGSGFVLEAGVNCSYILLLSIGAALDIWDIS